MSLQINNVVLAGNLGAVPELKRNKEGKPYAKVSLATNWGTKDDKKTSWHRLSFFDKAAETLTEYVTVKGVPIYVEGYLSYSTYTDKDNVERDSTEIIVTRWQFVESKGDAPAAQD